MQGTLIRTIENDPISPFGEPEVPPAEWTYRAWRMEALHRGVFYLRAYLLAAGERCGWTPASMPEWPRAASLTRKVDAFVNSGRWLWSCPLCNAAQVASYDDRRAFCVECFNAGDGWWPVVWPSDEDRRAIETVLAARGDDGNRNWLPSETVRDLQAENLEHGVNPDAPGYMMIGNPKVLADLKAPLRELGFNPQEGPEDALLDMDPLEVDRIVMEAIEGSQTPALERGDDGVDDA